WTQPNQQASALLSLSSTIWNSSAVIQNALLRCRKGGCWRTCRLPPFLPMTNSSQLLPASPPSSHLEKLLMLSVHQVEVDIQGSRTLDGITFQVQQGEFVCLLGRNGSGKTTTLRTIMGYRKPVSGSIEFGGAPISGLPSWKIARLGIGFSPEESEVFG